MDRIFRKHIETRESFEIMPESIIKKYENIYEK